MVMIICFAEDACQAFFDTTQFETYDQCMTQAVPVVNYMKEQDFKFYKDFIDNGGQPELSLTHPENTKDSI